MIRLLCPHCHASLAATELEQAVSHGQLHLLCPECTGILLSETLEAEEDPHSHGLAEHYPEIAFSPA